MSPILPAGPRDQWSRHRKKWWVIIKARERNKEGTNGLVIKVKGRGAWENNPLEKPKKGGWAIPPSLYNVNGPESQPNSWKKWDNTHLCFSWQARGKEGAIEQTACTPTWDPLQHEGTTSNSGLTRRHPLNSLRGNQYPPTAPRSSACLAPES